MASLREKMRFLEEDQELARTLGAEARRYLVENHSLGQFEKKWVETLELVVKRYEQG